MTPAAPTCESTSTRPEGLPPNLTVVESVDASCPDFDISDDAVRETLYESERRHFWFASRNAVIVQMMKRVGLHAPARFLEVGCGTGTVLAHLIRCGYRCDGVDMHFKLCREAASRCPQAGVYCLDITRPNRSMLKRRYQGVGLFDVLEHLREPTPLLSACAEMTESGGLVVGTVPALMALWSVVDEVGAHQRRYNRPMLRRELEAAGLKPVRISYFFQPLAPIIWLQRRAIRRKPADAGRDRLTVARRSLQVPARPINAAFRFLCSTERWASRVLPVGRAPGASLFFAAVNGDGSCSHRP